MEVKRTSIKRNLLSKLHYKKTMKDRTILAATANKALIVDNQETILKDNL